MFSQRHYIAIAKVIANRIDKATTLANCNARLMELDNVAQEFNTMFKADNPKYKPDVFFKACRISA